MRLPSNWKVPGSIPIVGKNFSFCKSRLPRLPHSWTKPMQMKLTVIYTQQIPCFIQGIIDSLEL